MIYFEFSPGCEIIILCDMAEVVPTTNNTNNKTLIIINLLLIDFRVKVAKITNYPRQRKTMILK